MNGIGIYDLIGLTGVFFMMYAYARVQWRRDYAKTLEYSVLNLVSAILLAVSLLDKWNLTFFVNNTIWGVISIYGIYRCLKYVWRARKAKRKS
jgi:cadmium resistance protein CadD (predicted permease)